MRSVIATHQRVRVLLQPYLSDFHQADPFLLLFLGVIVLSTVPMGWDGHSVTFFSVPLSLAGFSFDREKALLKFLIEIFDWAWLPLMFLIFSKLLQPLNESFTVSQLLWLRLTPCLPYEIALVRALLVMLYALALAILGGLWVTIAVLFHHISAAMLLVQVFGLVAYTLLAGGIVVAIDFGSTLTYSDRQLIPVLALLLPILLYPIQFQLSQLAHAAPLLRLLPYAAPVSGNSQQTILHFAMAAALGIVLLLIHVAIKAKFSLANETSIDQIRG
jgi:hypothetical protein